MGSDAWAVLQDKAPELANALLTGISSLASALDWHREDGARVLKFGINPVADMLPRDGDGFALRDAVAGGPQGEPDVSTQEDAPHCMLVAPNDDLAVWMNGALG
ncbi:hypothetical protein D3C80_1909710 [compost metagenome]